MATGTSAITGGVNNELDPVFRCALKLLHSRSPDSAEKLRISLDDIIKQKYGSHKMLINTLNKKFLAEESTAPGSIIPSKSTNSSRSSSRRHSHKSNDSRSSSSGNNTHKSNDPMDNASIGTIDDGGQSQQIVINVDAGEADDDCIIEDDHLKELEDLMCIICRRMDVSAKNRLIECADCHSLYHQDCHTPQIADTEANEQEFSWCCETCKNKIIKSSVETPTTPTTSTTTLSQNKTISSVPATSAVSATSSTQSNTAISTSSSSSSTHHKSSKSSRESRESSSSHSSRSKSSSKSGSSSSHKHSSSTSSSSMGISSSSTTSSGSSSSQAPSSSSSSTTTTSASSSSSSSSNNKLITPNINIISADKRLQIMKKKAAAKLHDSKRKHK